MAKLPTETLPAEAVPSETDPLPKNFFKAWREKAGLTQRQLAERMRISHASVSRVENGITPFTSRFLEGYALAVGATPLSLQNMPEEAARQERLFHLWSEVQKSRVLGDDTPAMMEAVRKAEEHLWKTLPPEVTETLLRWKSLPVKQRTAITEVFVSLRNAKVAGELIRILLIWQRLAFEQRKVAADILAAAFPAK